jgi:NitT/TauT family transport system permease protein
MLTRRPQVVKHRRGGTYRPPRAAFAEVDYMAVETRSASLPPPDAGHIPDDAFKNAGRRPPGGRKSTAPITAWLAPAALGVLVLLVWAALTHLAHVPALILPAPDAVLQSLWAGLMDGSLLSAAGATLLESLCGFALGAAIALPIGYGIARSRWLAWSVQPYVAASQALPAIALAPLFVVWLGYGLPPTAALAALIVFFPAAITTTLGIRALDPDVLAAARVDGAGRWDLLWAVELPLALPAILAGLRTSLTLSVTGAIVGEFVLGGFGTGLGSLLSQALKDFDTPGLFAILFVLGALAALLYGIARLIERRASHLEGQ